MSRVSQLLLNNLCDILFNKQAVLFLRYRMKQETMSGPSADMICGRRAIIVISRQKRQTYNMHTVFHHGLECIMRV